MSRVLILVMLLIPSVSVAQPPAPTSVDVLVLAAGSDPATATPVATLNTPISFSNGCNLDAPPAAPTPLVNPTTVFFEDPFAVGRFCRAALPSGLPSGTGYVAVAQLVAPTCTVDGSTLTPCPSLRSEVGTPPFNISIAPSCGPDASGHPAVALDVGDWTRNVSVKANGRVQYSLLNSRNPVTELIVKFNGEEQDRVTASDLRKVAGSYFLSGMVPGRYTLTVEARDASGCSAGANRPMTVTVK